MTISLITVPVQFVAQWDTTAVSLVTVVTYSLYKAVTTLCLMTSAAVAVPSHHVATVKHTTVDTMKMYI